MSSQTKEQHIVIVGGGMVGISLALVLSHLFSKALSNRSLSITLIERFAINAGKIKQPSFDDRSTALSAGTAEILKKIQCWSALEPHVEKIQSVHVSDRGHFGGTQLQAKQYALDALGYVVENKQLGHILSERLQQQAIQCLAPASVQQCSPKKKGYQLSVDCDGSQQTLHADLLLIADGADSPLRSTLGIATDTADYQQSALIANVALDRSHQGVAYERFTDEGPMALLPLPELKGVSRAALVWTVPEEKGQSLLAADKETFIQCLQQRFGFRAGMVTNVGKRQSYPLQFIKAEEQIRSHLALVGNAAHFLHPVAGQGFNLALRDCWVLANCLRDADEQELRLGDFSTLRLYMDKQESDQTITMSLTDGLVRLFSSQRLPKVVLRQLGLLSLNCLPLAKEQFAQKMMGVN